MEEIWEVIRQYPKTYVLLVSLAGTVLIVNESLNFAERLINSKILLVVSLAIFYFLAQTIIFERKRRKKTNE